ncbi:hypothetical protein [Mucilaginibacter sp. AK015]|uniref:hypothetical protein n=1 Tax=Mucilaginibacter sp. AK015 TaxID=2723072 RepID=UPI00161E34A8|nr:hypothetical protein [Mucilaginibacter sp. AK015]MBB5396199.1 hypothetical protein [Mucilaginibacter sp. AK015]
METPKRILISYQNTCDAEEVGKLITYLKEAGFDVQHGNFSNSDFDKIVDEVESYVCILDQNSHRSTDLAREIIKAAKAGKKVFAIYCPTTDIEIQLPSSLDICATAITEWDAEKLRKGLNGEDIGFSDQKGQQKPLSRSTKPPKC